MFRRLSSIQLFLLVFGASHVQGQSLTYSVIYSFNGGPDGAGPGPIIQDVTGNL